MPSDSRIICDGCNDVIPSNARILHCGCNFDICIPCALKSPHLASKHKRLQPGFIDAHDGRPTFIKGPGIDEFGSLVTKMKQSSSSWKLPKRYYQFFARCEIDGISREQLASMDRYEGMGVNNSSATTKKIENDYTVYMPLDRDKKEIRLVFLKAGSQNDPLVMATHTVPYPWTKNHEWIALSYTWGSMDETRQIFLGHSRCKGDTGEEERDIKQVRPFNCTASLEMMLRALRPKSNDVFFWIDALCINQGDLEERAHQVAMMAQIYRHASCVGIWLGANSDTASAARHVKGLSVVIKMAKEVDEPDHCKHDHHLLERMARDMNISDNPLSYSQLGPRISSFFSNPWFSRAWVVQEVWAAKSIVVMCGKGGILSWNSVMLANQYLNIYAATLRSAPSAVDEEVQQGPRRTVDGGHSIWLRLLKNPDDAEELTPIPLIELLDSVTCMFKASDKRDLLYALLGMSVETHGTIDHPRTIAPDYTKPLWQVYSDFTRWYITYHKSLNILGYVTYTNRGENAEFQGSVPSWSFSPTLKIPWRAGGTISDRTPFQADANMTMDIDLIGGDLGDHRLVVQGYEIDTVSWVDDCFFAPMLHFKDSVTTYVAHFPWRISPQSVLDPATCGIEWLWKMVRARGEVGRCNVSGVETTCKCQHVLNAMLDAITCGRWMRLGLRVKLEEIPLADIRYELLEQTKLYSYFASHWVATTSDPEMKQHFCERLRRLLLPLVEESSKDKFADGTTEASFKNSLFMTKSGAMGVCSPDARPDDKVVVLFGCRMPVVLRQRLDDNTLSDEESHHESTPPLSSWEFIGECYVGGIMYGEAVAEKKKANVPLQTFTLR